jgi:VWFA-related protein
MKSRAVFYLVFLLLLATVFAPLAAAQSGLGIEFHPTGEADETPLVDDAGFPQLRLTLTPLSDSGVPIGGLSAGDFTVSEDGAPVENLSVSERIDPAQGISVVLVLDVSGSMLDDVDALRAAATALYDQVLEQTDESAIVTFAALEDGSTVNLSDPFPQLTQGREANFTSDEGLLKNLINGVVVNEGDGTPLYDAIYKGARLAREEAANSRRVVIVMTDGVDADRQGVAEQGSAVYDRNSVIDELRELNVPVFTVGLGDEIDSPFLQRVANTTGGTYQNAPTAAALAGIFTELASQLKVKYDLSFESRTLSDGEQHNLEIQARTPLGAAADSAAFQAHFPIQPQVYDVQAANPRQPIRDLTTFEGVKGRVMLRPTIVAREDIAAVNYYVDDTLVYTAEASPWEFTWNTSELAPNEVHRLRIEAVDDSTPANVGGVDFQLLVEECTVICQIEQTTGIPANYLLIGLIVLLLLFLLLLWLLRRRRREPEPAYPTPVYTPVFEAAPPPATPAPAPATMKPTLGAEALPDFAPAGRRPRAKTEVLDRSAGPIAFLIDAETGRQFRLSDGTTIGSAAENDLILDETAVSGQHAKVKFENGAYAIFDLASTNGTEVNGAPITHHVLADGDTVRIGRKTLVYKMVGSG